MIYSRLINVRTLNMSIFKDLMKDMECNDIKELMELIKKMDIREFVKYDKAIDFEPTERQFQIMEGIMNKTMAVVLLGKGSGKTTLNAIVMRFMVLKELCKEKLDTMRVDFCNMCSNAKVARKTFFRELKLQLDHSRFFNLIKGLYKAIKEEISFMNDAIMIHSLNSETSSFEGMNIKMALIDEISDINFKNSLTMWEQACGSAFTRYDDAKVVAITWTRFPTANKMSDVGYYLYDKYKDNDDVYTVIASHEYVRGSKPKNFDKDDIKHLKMYCCEFVVDEDTTIDISHLSFVKREPLLYLDVKPDDKFMRFKIKRFVKPKDKYRFCHIDTSVSRDSTVIALYYGDFIEYHVIRPEKSKVVNGKKTKAKPISYEDLEALVYELRKYMQEISFDQFNSEFFVQKFDCMKHTFANSEQYKAIKYFKNQMNEIKIIRNPDYHERLIYEMSNININNDTEKWTYMGKGSSDIADSVLYCVFNSREYENQIKRSRMRKSTKIGINVNLFNR